MICVDFIVYMMKRWFTVVVVMYGEDNLARSQNLSFLWNYFLRVRYDGY